MRTLLLPSSPLPASLLLLVLMSVAVMLVTGAPTPLTVDSPRRADDFDDWNNFKLQYKRNYSSDIEENFRKSIFDENQSNIALHNEKYYLGLTSYKIKMNQFGDMMFDEYRKYMHVDNRTLSKLKRVPRGEAFQSKLHDPDEVPEQVDWRERGAVTPVQDQGLTCGSCWAFSAIGALEGQYFRKTGTLTALSAQSLIDCTASYGNLGCEGGSAALSFQFAADYHGLAPEALYAYKGQTDRCHLPKVKCREKPSENRAHNGDNNSDHANNDDDDDDDDIDDDEDESTDASFVYVAQADEQLLRIAVATIGPLSAAIDGSHDTFRFYSEGIYYQPKCSEKELDHAILIVGYGTSSNGQDYWLIKNSWGVSWGEAGYLKIARNRQNHCGIAAAAIYPVV